MLKPFVMTALILSANVAFACGGKPCDHCDGPSTADVKDISKAPGTHVALAVTGMKCGACSAKVTAALEKLDGVNAVSVDHESGKAEVAFDDKKTTVDAMIAEIEKLHFTAKAEDSKAG